jgi:hypothetical protein
MNQEWTIQSRAHQCAVSGQPFEEDEVFYTLLYLNGGEFRREDVCDAVFRSRDANAPEPFSFWKTKYQKPPAAPVEAVTKQTAEGLLRRYVEEARPEHEAVRFVLALMLERKRLLKETAVKRSDDGKLIRIYEQPKSGDVFLIVDPELRLDQVAGVQEQVAALLAAPASAQGEGAGSTGVGDAQAGTSDPPQEPGVAE